MLFAVLFVVLVSVECWASCGVRCVLSGGCCVVRVAVCCLLVGCSLCGVRYLVYADWCCCMLFVGCLSVVCCVLFVLCCFGVCCSLVDVCCLLFGLRLLCEMCCWLVGVRCALCVVCYVMFWCMLLVGR